MKKLVLTLFLLLISAPAFAGTTIRIIGGAAAGGDDCLSDTYLFSYDGDHSSGTAYACYDSGNSSEDASEKNADSYSTEYIAYDDVDENTTWNISGDITDLDGEGSLFVSIYVPVDGTYNRAVSIVESYIDANNFFACYTDNAANARVNCDRVDNSAASGTYTSGKMTDTPTWWRLGYTWKAGTGHDISLVTLGNGETWENEDADNVAQWSSDPDEITIGDKDANKTPSPLEGIRVKDLIITSTYQDSDPLYP